MCENQTRRTNGDNSRMKALIWKLRFTARFCWMTRMPLRYGWQCAESNLDMVKGDTAVPPSELVDDEIEESLRG